MENYAKPEKKLVCETELKSGSRLRMGKVLTPHDAPVLK